MRGLAPPSSTTTLSDRLTWGATRLGEAGIDAPRREARLLLAHAAGLDAAALLSRMDTRHPAPDYAALIARRARREPLALIVGHQPFWTLDLLVSADTLIPRADSETLIEAALDACPGRTIGRVLDLGTGTGCLLLAALAEFGHATGVGIDRNPAAAALARTNARRCGLAHRAALLCGHWADAIRARFDLVLCNPPYIETAAIAGLMPEVARHEPASALDGGADGLAAYRDVIAALPALIAPGGMAILELGAGQVAPVRSLALANGLLPQAPRRDLAGIERALPLTR